MIIDFIATIFEELILSISISYFLKTSHQLAYILFTSMLCIIETYLFSFFYIDNIILILLIIITHSIILLLIDQDNFLQKISTIIFFVFILLFSNYIALYIFSTLNNIPVIELRKNVHIFSFTVIFSKFLFASFSLFFCMYFKKENYNFLIEKYEVIIAIILDIIFIFTLLGEALVYGNMINSVILIIMLQLIVLSILICLLYNKIQIENREKIALVKKSTKLEYLRINNDKISHMYDTVISKEHNMIYFLRKLKILLNDEKIENENITNLIDVEIEKIISYKFISNTGNPNFDIEISNKINMLKEEGFDLKIILMIGNDPRINNTYVIDKVNQFIDFISLYSKTKKIELRIKEKNNVLILKGISSYINDIPNEYKKKILNGGIIESINEMILLDDDYQNNKRK